MKITLLLLFVMIPSCCEAQIRAITEQGEEVILYYDGTWKYVSYVEKGELEIKKNPIKFIRNQENNELIKSEVSLMEVYFDNKKWKFKKKKSSMSSEFEIESFKYKHLFGVLVFENTNPDIILLTKHILDLCQKQSKDSIKIVTKEFRTINNCRVLFVKHELKLKKNFTYWRYFFSNEDGCGQLSLATAKEITPEVELEIEDLLNGIVMILK